jgi:hypothetical protein
MPYVGVEEHFALILHCVERLFISGLLKGELRARFPLALQTVPAAYRRRHSIILTGDDSATFYSIGGNRTP